jgi:DNA-binding transcriptional MerR regulator
VQTVKEVARASGISVRALHHYDHIGLLTPEVGTNGYRYYGQPELLRLQHILFYRELGVPLLEIVSILDDPGFDTRAALLDLRRRIDAEIVQRRDLAQTIDRTLALLDSGRPLNEARLFDGISPAKQAGWEAELVERFGEPANRVITEARATAAGLSTGELLNFKAEIDSIHAEFVKLIEAGGSPSSPAAQTLTQRHYQWVCRSWRPDAEAYVVLGRLYGDQADFRAMYDAMHPNLATFLSEAMAVYARRTLRGVVR